MGYVKQNKDGEEAVDWKKTATIKWGDKATLEKIDAIIYTPDNRIFGRKEIDPNKLIYYSETFDYKEAAKRENAFQSRSKFIVKKNTAIYPDTLCWNKRFLLFI
ncbi:MAG: hypothetical protein WDM71_04875 [Ferruginibacter sp.]